MSRASSRPRWTRWRPSATCAVVSEFMMTFNAGRFNQPGAPSQVGGATGGAQASPAGEAAGADFAALLTETWSTPLNSGLAEPAEEHGDQEPSEAGGTDEQPAMP